MIKVYSQNHSTADTARLIESLIGYDGSFLKDEKWITVHGTHIRLDRSGNPVSGPRRLRKALSERATPQIRARMPKDVTDEYRRTAKPGKGKVKKGPGYKMEDSPKGRLERETADWLVKTFGGDVTLNRQTSRKGETGKNPEYIWRNRLWEFKEPDKPTWNAIQQELRYGLRQIKNNPGGVVMDITKCGASFDLATEAINYRANRSANFPVDVIILKRGSDYKVLRFDTKKETGQNESDR